MILMRRWAAIAALSIIPVLAQQSAESPKPDAEQEALRKAVTESSSSSIDLMRALEGHIQKFPNSPRRPEILRAIVKSAIELKDDRKIAQYGPQVLATSPDDLSTLDRVTRALLTIGDADSNKKALDYAKHFEELLRTIAKQPAPSAAESAHRQEEIDRALARALLSQAIATGNLGNAAPAAQLARKSFETYPSVEAAAELGRRYQQTNQFEPAIMALADAFTVPDTSVTEADRTTLRRRMSEVWRKWKGTDNETGLGDIVLKAYDRNIALLEDRRTALKSLDPNSGISNPMQFTLNGVTGDKLPMYSLLGKAVVLDFWATWCGPCRGQHPLYEKVKDRFKDNKDVVFLAINTDEERDAVKPFLKEQGWSEASVYYEDGLSKALRVSNIPTTVVISRDGAILSRMNGYDPERFVDVLTDRIKEALKVAAR